MAIYDKDGTQIYSSCSKDGSELLKAYDVSGEQIWSKTGKISFRVMSYNVQWFTKTNLYKDVIDHAFVTQDADIVGMQEYTLSSDNTTQIDGVPIRTYIQNKGYTDFRIGTLANNKTALASKFNTTALSEHAYSVHGSEVRSYIKSYITIGGKTVAFYNTHLDPYNQSYRATQIQELMADAALEDMFVMTGDFNVACLDTSHADYINVIKPLIDAGYNVANCNPNRDGFIPTWTDSKIDYSQQGYWCTDNIITSANINMVDVWVDDYKVTHNPDQYDLDHVPIVADLEFVIT